MGVEWTAEMVQEAAEMLRAGTPTMEVAAHFGAGYSALIDVLRRHDIRLTDLRPPVRNAQRTWTAAEDEILRHEWLSGTPVGEIGALLKRTPWGIEARRARLHLPLRPRGGERTASAAAQARASAPVSRRCLVCRQEFPPAWRTNYICAACSHTESFNSPVTVHGFCV